VIQREIVSCTARVGGNQKVCGEGWQAGAVFWESRWFGQRVWPAEIRTILFDPQTVGGLPLSVAHVLLIALTSAGVPAVEIGEVLPLGKPLIQVV
jgi:hypothetical protein